MDFPFISPRPALVKFNFSIFSTKSCKYTQQQHGIPNNKSKIVAKLESFEFGSCHGGGMWGLAA